MWCGRNQWLQYEPKPGSLWLYLRSWVITDLNEDKECSRSIGSLICMVSREKWLVKNSCSECKQEQLFFRWWHWKPHKKFLHSCIVNVSWSNFTLRKTVLTHIKNPANISCTQNRVNIALLRIKLIFKCTALLYPELYKWSSKPNLFLTNQAKGLWFEHWKVEY